ncbi:iron chelate uptake ABC transporter family permease subunit [Rhodobacteraceae bacterium NNCM2]|nr:iron chelate uptake ABC transporter family permease subunit [Coraliihabitans acroporae]
MPAGIFGTGQTRLWQGAAVILIAALAALSIFIGAADVSGGRLWSDPDALSLLLDSRVPRTLALILAGISTAIAGMIMQILAQNRFVEPSTVGTVESATLGLLVVTLFAPHAPVLVRMLAAAIVALGGTMLFLKILRTVPLRSPLIAPLIGIALAGVIGSITSFIAWRTDLMQAMNAWTTGDFSVVLSGRYELLWVSAALTLVAWIAADKFSVAGLGEDTATSLGLSHRKVMMLGLTIVAGVTASVIVTVGVIPFLGLIAPNVVSLAMGDNLRRALPAVALLGAGLTLACDIFGRIVVHPYELPIGVTMGVLGAIVFLYLLLRRGSRVG